ncbi:hypothetical protein M438DRAFT_361355 [Aureobasidium pullulans EXF-150]|uniref:AAA+ ATPase domain-containing protein n=1 Tax=Aureobasidium pullulans EXF-150 TaxID=1043002 RepID=A0A074Y6Q8_AURPU|nr:uncharacterized protein M438DRAFT_361355 [Aureobasidium pullulans EXF-150]KEQ89922.1 hypothetical protein M438DRAFT_361355 [Aureobasidium pullulans EXF-150]
MAEALNKRKPPPRPLKRSSLSGNQVLLVNDGLPHESYQSSEPDMIRNLDNVVRLQPKRDMTELIKADDTPLEAIHYAKTASESVKEDIPSFDHNRPRSRSDTSKDGEILDSTPLAVESPGLPSSQAVEGQDVDKGSIEGQPVADKDGEALDREYNVPSDDNFREKLMNAPEVGKTSERQPCIPQLRRVDWYNFKNKWIEERKHAIEVLRGPAKHYQDRNRETKRVEKLKKAGNNPARSLSEEGYDISPPQDAPERIRINSVPILAVIEDLDPITYRLELNPTLPTTMLRPYMRLIRMEDMLMNHLSDLETKWAVAESEELKRKADSTFDITNDERAAPKTPQLAKEDSIHSLPASALSLSPTTKESAQNEKDKQDHSTFTTSDPLTDSIEALRDLRCLKQFFELYIHPTVDRFRSKTARKVRFADLWYLFPYGEEIFLASALGAEARSSFTQTAESGAYQSVFRVYDHSGGRLRLSNPDDDEDESNNNFQTPSAMVRIDPFHIMCYHIDWDSKSHSPVYHKIQIKPFEGERDITSLDVYPTKYHKDFEPIRQQLLTRGHKFLKLTKPTHMRYYGRTYDSHPCGDNSSHSLSATSFVESEVMVDFEQSPRGWQPNFGLDEFLIYEIDNVDDWPVTFWQDKEHNLNPIFLAEFVFMEPEDTNWLRERARDQNGFLRDWNLYQAGHRTEPIQTLESDDDLVLLPSRVMGYSYRDRTFNAFNIDHLELVTPKSEGFDGLALPKGHQMMVEALVKEHFIKKEAYEKHGRSAPGMDMISGKGRGLIMLLHGYPGVGKTSTAECVAQSTGRPLFSITCGDLGLDPVQVETSLNDKFRLAAKWNCVLLLDEADVFLARRESRDKDSLERNALVSVFLRVLEYYEGILILTTNRVGTFDDAFKSRIHVSLHYPPLKKAQTIKIWEKNLIRLKKIEEARAEMTGNQRLVVQDREILAYAAQHYMEHKESAVGLWNGRQIRNAFQTAAALAYHNADENIPILSPQLFRDVAKTTDEFDQYVFDLNGQKDEAQRAYDRMERVDNLRKETDKRSRGTHLTRAPMTPVPDPRDRFFSDNGRQNVRIKLEDSGYKSREGLVNMTSEHAVLTSSASSSQVLTDTARMTESVYTSSGAAMHASSPNIASRTTRVPMKNDGQRYNEMNDTENEEDEDEDEDE